MVTHNRESEALVADIGGTNARFALADLHSGVIHKFRRYPRAAFPSLETVAQKFLQECNGRPVVGALAVAAPLDGDLVQMTNSPWWFSRQELKSALGLTSMIILNDFEALARSLPLLGPADTCQIGGEEPVLNAPKVVLGPGTGLGVAALIRAANEWQTIASEGGHASFAAMDADEFALLQRLGKEWQRVSAERVLSGPGLVATYRALSNTKEKADAALTAPDIVQRARMNTDGNAVRALEYFVTWLGRFAGDAALFFSARGGVYIGGGIAPNILANLTASLFRRAFENKGRLTGYLKPVPIYMITSKDATLKGAATVIRA